jgi:hypothetical protein
MGLEVGSLRGLVHLGILKTELPGASSQMGYVLNDVRTAETSVQRVISGL